MRLYTDPTYNKVAPNARAAAPDFSLRWDRIRACKEPYASPTTGSFEYWFNYFFGEAVTREGGAPRVTKETPVSAKLGTLTPAERVALVESFEALFDLPAAPAAAVPVPKAGALARLSVEQKFAILHRLLVIGMVRVHVPAVDRRVPAGVETAVDGDALQTMYTIASLQGGTVPIAFRGDDRTYEQLVAQGGFRPRARSQGSPIVAKYGLDQPWHPFSAPLYRDSIFVRRGGNLDNCLHTVVSVGTHLEDLIHFPITKDVSVFGLQDASGTYLARKSLDEWTPADVDAARRFGGASEYLLPVYEADGRTLDHLLKRQRFYVMHLAGTTGFNTRAFFAGTTAPFRERAMHDVPVANILLELTVLKRYWSGPEVGLDAYAVELERMRVVPSPATVTALFGVDAIPRLRTLVTSAMTAANDCQSLATVRHWRTSMLARRRAGVSGAVQQAIIAEIRRIRAATKKPNRASELPLVLAALGALRAGDAARYAFDEQRVKDIGPADWSTLANGKRLY